MKLPLLPLLALGLLSSSVLPATARDPIYEETFNREHVPLRLINGAALGGPGTGVSGKAGDRAYVSLPRSTEQEPGGPAAIATSPVAAKPLSAFTCVFWYYLEDHTPDLQVIADTAGVSFLMHRKGFEVRVSTSEQGVRQHQFLPGQQGPILDWTTPGRWVFAAFTWECETNTMTVHQGTADVVTVFMRSMNRAAPTTPTSPRENLDRTPEVLGNTYSKQDRPLAGRLDNFRLFDRVMNQVELEALRRADLANELVIDR